MSTDFDAVTKWFYENHMALNDGNGKDTGNETFNFKDLVRNETFNFKDEGQQRTNNTWGYYR